jgi:phage-related minor tail protein
MQLAGAVGEQLKPVFYALLAIVINIANFLLELAQNSEPVVTVFKSLFQQVTNLYNSMMGLVQQIFPNLSKQTVSATAVMKGLAVVFQSLLLPVRASFLAIQAMIESLGALMSGGKALVKFLQGDFVGASKTWDDAKKQFSNMTKHANDNFTQIKKGFKDALVDTPKKLEPEAVLAAATTENKKQNVVTEEQKKAAEKRAKEAEKNRKKDENEEKKHLEQIAKANEEALKRIAEYEAETNINSIRDELEREIAKINEKARKRKAENEASLADKALKEKLETIIEKEAEAERQKVRDEYKAKEAKKQEEAAQKRLETEKFVQEQEKKAESALLDWKEVQAGTNARKLVEIRKERLALELKYTQEKLDTELQIEKKKAEREISDTQQKKPL